MLSGQSHGPLHHSEAAPYGWEAHVDQASGHIYYIHAATGETSFQLPALASSSSAAALVQTTPSLLPMPLNGGVPLARSSEAIPLGINVVHGGAAGPSCNSRRSAGAREAVPGASSAEVVGVPAARGSCFTSSFLARKLATHVSSVFGAAAPEGARISELRPRALVYHRLSRRQCSPRPDGGSYEWVVLIDPTPPPRPRASSMLGPFASEQEAKAAAAALVPPVWQPDAEACTRCSRGFGMLRRRAHCRNCGYSFCHSCCVTWPKAALPPSYLLPTDHGDVRVCIPCDQASDEFRVRLQWPCPSPHTSWALPDPCNPSPRRLPHRAKCPASRTSLSAYVVLNPSPSSSISQCPGTGPPRSLRPHSTTTNRPWRRSPVSTHLLSHVASCMSVQRMAHHGTFLFAPTTEAFT